MTLHCIAKPINCLAASKIPPLASGSQSTKDQSQVANLTTWDKTKPLPRPTPPQPPETHPTSHPQPHPQLTPTPNPQPYPPTPTPTQPQPQPPTPTHTTPTPPPPPPPPPPYLLVDDSCRLPYKPVLDSLRRVFFFGACPGKHKR